MYLLLSKQELDAHFNLGSHYYQPPLEHHQGTCCMFKLSRKVVVLEHRQTLVWDMKLLQHLVSLLDL